MVSPGEKVIPMGAIERQGRFERVDRHPNERRKYCGRCGKSTIHLYDHGRGMYRCGCCELD